VVLKVLGLVLMLVAFVGCVPEASLPGTLLLAGQAIPANWFCCAGVSIVFLACSWFFQQFPLRREPARRTVSGHWFLADSFLDITSGTAALLYAAAAALLLLTVTVFDLAEHAALPYILSAEGLLLLLFGYLTRTPQAKMAGALLLIGAHVTYQLLLWMGHPPFDEFGAYDHVAVAMAVATLGAGVAWERFLARAPRGKTSIDHVVASIPFLAGAYMLTSLSARDLQAAHAALLQNGLGVGLLMMAYIAGSAGAVAGGTLALAVGTATYFGWLFQPESTIANDPRFLPILAAMLLTYAVSERVLRRSYPPQTRLSHASDMVRSALVAAAGTLGILSLNQWAPDHQLTLFWLAHAVLGMALGVLFRESRYRWAALLIFAVAISRAVLYDLRALPLHYQILSFAALMAVFLAVSRAYLKYREKTASGTRPRRSGESSIHG